MSFNKRQTTLASCLGLFVFCGFSTVAQASGFALREQSAEGLGDAFAGQTAKAYNASTVFYNPAGMTNLNDSEVAGTTTWISPVSQFHGSNTNLLGGTVAGRDNVNAIKAAAIGSVFGVWNASPDWKFGLSVATPFGMRSDYKVDWVGRYQALASDVTDIDVSVVGAYKFDDHFSIGGGPRIDYLKARLSQAVNYKVIGMAAASQAAAAGQVATAAALQTAAQSWGDGPSKVEGDDIAAGYNVGLLYVFNPETRVGLDYRSRSSHTLSGNVTYLNPSTLPASIASSFTNQDATAKITLPDSLNIGAYHEIDSQWTLLSDIQWTHWSLFKQLNVIGANGQSISSTPENWHDTWFVSLGTHYKPNDKWTFHGGVAFDQSPVKSEDRTARIPDSNRYWLSTGATYALTRSVDLNLGYTHIFADKASLSESANRFAGVLTGSYDNSVDIVSTSFSMRF